MAARCRQRSELGLGGPAAVVLLAGNIPEKGRQPPHVLGNGLGFDLGVENLLQSTAVLCHGALSVVGIQPLLEGCLEVVDAMLDHPVHVMAAGGQGEAVPAVDLQETQAFLVAMDLSKPVWRYESDTKASATYKKDRRERDKKEPHRR